MACSGETPGRGSTSRVRTTCTDPRRNTAQGLQNTRFRTGSQRNAERLERLLNGSGRDSRETFLHITHPARLTFVGPVRSGEKKLNQRCDQEQRRNPCVDSCYVLDTVNRDLQPRSRRFVTPSAAFGLQEPHPRTPAGLSPHHSVGSSHFTRIYSVVDIRQRKAVFRRRSIRLDWTSLAGCGPPTHRFSLPPTVGGNR